MYNYLFKIDYILVGSWVNLFVLFGGLEVFFGVLFVICFFYILVVKVYFFKRFNLFLFVIF